MSFTNHIRQKMVRGTPAHVKSFVIILSLGVASLLSQSLLCLTPALSVPSYCRLLCPLSKSDPLKARSPGVLRPEFPTWPLLPSMVMIHTWVCLSCAGSVCGAEAEAECWLWHRVKQSKSVSFNWMYDCMGKRMNNSVRDSVGHWV